MVSDSFDRRFERFDQLSTTNIETTRPRWNSSSRSTGSTRRRLTLGMTGGYTREQRAWAPCRRASPPPGRKSLRRDSSTAGSTGACRRMVCSQGIEPGRNRCCKRPVWRTRHQRSQRFSGPTRTRSSPAQFVSTPIGAQAPRMCRAMNDSRRARSEIGSARRIESRAEWRGERSCHTPSRASRCQGCAARLA